MSFAFRRVPNGVGPNEFVDYLRALSRTSDEGIATAHRAQYKALAHAPGPRWKAADQVPKVPVRRQRLPLARVTRRYSWQDEREPEDYDVKREAANVIANAEAVGIVIGWSRGPRRLGGLAHRSSKHRTVRRDPSRPPLDFDVHGLPPVVVGHGVVWLNVAGDPSFTTFEVLLHELAHFLLGHLGGWDTPARRDLDVGDRTHVPRWPGEVEADAAAYLAALHRGFSWVDSRRNASTMVRRIQTGYVLTYAREEVPHVDLLQIVHVADILASWCTDPPDASAVRSRDWDGPHLTLNRTDDLEVLEHLLGLWARKPWRNVSRGLGRISELDREDRR